MTPDTSPDHAALGPPTGWVETIVRVAHYKIDPTPSGRPMAPLRSALAARRLIAAHSLPRVVPLDSIAELIDRYEADPGPAALVELERALVVTGPVLYRSAVYGIAEPRAVESLEVFRDVKRAELVRVP